MSKPIVIRSNDVYLHPILLDFEAYLGGKKKKKSKCCKKYKKKSGKQCKSCPVNLA